MNGQFARASSRHFQRNSFARAATSTREATAEGPTSGREAFNTGGDIDHTKHSPGLHLKTYICIVFIVFFAPLGNVLLSKGMKGIGSARTWVPGDILHILGRILTSGYIWLGIGCLLAFFVTYMLVLTWADYSYVQPASAFSYAVVATLSYFLLKENVPLLRWVGILIICGGVLIVSRTHPRTTERP